MYDGDMLTRTSAEHFAHSWIQAWNAHDLDTLLSHYSDDVEVSSPFVAPVAGNPSGTIRGKPALRAYWQQALTRFPDLRFVLLGVCAGVSSITLRYRSVLDLIAMEVFILGPDGKIAKVLAHYNEPDIDQARKSHQDHAAWLWTSQVTPILNVSNMAQSIEWFEKLGFCKCWDWGNPPTFAAVGSGEIEIFLCQGAQGGRGKSSLKMTGGPDGSDDQEKGVWMSLWVGDVDAVHARCIQKGIEVTMPPTNEPWGVREMHARHPDGHVLRISKGLSRP